MNHQLRPHCQSSKYHIHIWLLPLIIHISQPQEEFHYKWECLVLFALHPRAPNHRYSHHCQYL